MLQRMAIIAAFLLLALPLRAQAPSLADAAGRYVLTPQGSRLSFSVPAAGGRAIRGRFVRFAGRIDIPADNIERARVIITIFPESVATGERRVDNFLKSNAVFDVAHEHEITFRSTAVHRTGAATATVEGSLTARGHTFRETFRVRLAEFGRGRARFHVEGRVLRSRYGMDVGTPLYSNVVDFDMDLAARRG
ncbi:YceI family protein [Mesorhizobium xinjiangense]|uniref:YceI family protein n=1 Tax=Mesorhizobium xinjiangense TaxID=2678685 RepID=UPI0012EE0C5C|nr:YceI family protein [Mesorhizobium xinjiangense]